MCNPMASRRIAATFVRQGKCSKSRFRCFSSAVPASPWWEEGELSMESFAWDRIPASIVDMIHCYKQKPETCPTLAALLRSGRGEFLDDRPHPTNVYNREDRILLQVANFVRREIPIQLAHRIDDLDRVPMMRDMPAVQAVKSTYLNSFLELLRQPSELNTLEQEQDFCRVLQTLYDKHSNVMIQMAQGANQLRQAIATGELPGQLDCEEGVDFADISTCHDFLDRFYSSRIGIRVLAGQYMALRGECPPGYVGMVCQHTSPKEIVSYAVQDATAMCQRRYADAPEVSIEGRTDLTFAYIPTHLHYILLELIKNAMRATVEKHAKDSELPPVTIIIADGADNEDVVIKVMDEGGGIRRSQMDKIWSYLFTTADSQIQERLIAGVQDHGRESPIAGLGYGLPISRAYARFFGGDLDIMSMEGYGTDAYVHLRRIGADFQN